MNKEKTQTCSIKICRTLMFVSHHESTLSETRTGLYCTSGLLRFCMICLSESLLAKYLVHPRFRYCNRGEKST